MSRIAVTEEVIADEAVRRAMLFDPYDWRSVAERIEWGLANRETLLAMQRPVYQMLSKRSWREVVDDHVRILEAASAPSVRIPLPGRQAG
jgi:glycosyltransferase involved in cell wall biosynthesis